MSRCGDRKIAAASIHEYLMTGKVQSPKRSKKKKKKGK